MNHIIYGRKSKTEEEYKRELRRYKDAERITDNVYWFLIGLILGACLVGIITAIP